MQPNLSSRLAIKQAVMTVAAALVLSAFFTVGQLWADLSRERARVSSEMKQVMEVVGRSAAQAGFGLDQRFAVDVVHGLLAYEPVKSATLSDDRGRILAQEDRGTNAVGRNFADRMFPDTTLNQTLTFQRPTGELLAVGMLEVRLDSDALATGFLSQIRLTIATLVVQNLVLGLVLAFLVHLTLTLPLVRITRSLRSIDHGNPANGLSITLPEAKRKDELGQLVAGLTRTFRALSESIGEREKADAAARESETRFRDLIEGSVQGIVILAGRSPVFANDALSRMCGLEGGARLTAVEDILQLLHMDDRAEFGAAVDATAKSGNDGNNLRCRIIRPDGSVVWLLAALRRIDWFGGHAVQAILVDTTEQVHAEGQLRTMATRDPLTHLANRTLITENLDHAVTQARLHGSQVALLYFDLDRFKLINDTFGHDVGDQLIWAVSRRLLPLAEAGATLARLGSDEFVLLMEEGVTEERASEVAQAMLDAFRQPVALSGRQLVVTPSVGISMFPSDAQDGKALMRNADVAMYVAKGAGGNCFHFFTADMNDRAVRRLEIESDLREALKSHQFELYYQPKLLARSPGRPVGLEALLRWKHPERGWVSPADFIPVAEETGLIAQIGERVIHEACRQAAAWLDEYGVALPVAVNVSTRQLSDRNLVTMIANTLTMHRLDPQYLEVEITESAAMQSIDHVMPLLNDLRSIGVSVTIDDFGTGYSSLSYLKRLPIACLKLDRSFVKDLPGDQEDVTIASAVISLGHALGLKVVAEGVETEEQVDFLNSRKCDYLQGFLFSRPVPAHEIASKYLEPLKLDPKRNSDVRSRLTVLPGGSGRASQAGE